MSSPSAAPSPTRLSAGTVPPLGTTTESVTFTPTDATDYSPVLTSVTVTVLVPISITLTSSANIVVPGQPVTLTATVTSAKYDHGTPTGGYVYYYLNGGYFSEAVLSNGVATIITGLDDAGSYAITAEYGPTSEFTGAVSNTVYELATPYSVTTRGTTQRRPRWISSPATWRWTPRATSTGRP